MKNKSQLTTKPTTSNDSMTDYLADIKKYFQREVGQIVAHPVGSTSEDIAKLESMLGHQLPKAYRQYLEWMGNDHAGVFVGCDWFLHDVPSNTRYLPELLKENEVEWTLPSGYCSFMGHQGYIAAYFELPATDDNPEVFFFSEGRESNTVTNEGRFTDFLFRDLSGMIECVKSNHQSRNSK